MYDYLEYMLSSILDCGSCDVYLLEDCKYDLGEIVEECEMIFGRLEINDLVRTMFIFGIRDIQLAITERLCEFDDIVEERGKLTKKQLEERDALESLEPMEDIQSFHNYLDTHIWIDADQKIEIYTKYLQKALDNFYEMTGYEIGVDYSIN